ncbi:MAG: FeoC-like transcriptional regulator [Candidatus Bipolaricaulia bacterium]
MTKEPLDRSREESEEREKAAGLRMTDLLTLPDSLRQLVNWIMRNDEVSLADVVTHTGEDEKAVHAMLAALVEKGFVTEMDVEGELRYRIHLAPKQGPQLSQDIWKVLDEEEME